MTSEVQHYLTVLANLRASYDGSAGDREGSSVEPWKVELRANFLERLQAAGARTLLEVGAGVGRDSQFFEDNGLDVTATDLSPEMVRFCREKGLNAHVMDFWGLKFRAESFDAVYAMNCLLHVPSTDFLGILRHICQFIKPGGLFFLGQYGGGDQEGVVEGDNQDPPRFYRLYNDERIFSIVSQVFEVIDFEPIDFGSSDQTRRHFQALTLSRAGGIPFLGL
jgi:SAM-dependent methyltransferase